MNLTSKLVFLILLAIGGTLIVVVRTLTSWLEKKSGMDAIDKIKKNPSMAAVFSASHDMVYGQRINFKPAYFDELKNYVLSTTSIGDYVVMYGHVINSDEIILFTNLTYQDFDVTLTGRSDDVDKTILTAFTLRYIRAEKVLNVFSDIHSNTNQKFQKEGLIRALFPDNY